MRTWHNAAPLFSLATCLGFVGCGGGAVAGLDMGVMDLVFPDIQGPPGFDVAPFDSGDLAPTMNACGDVNPSCAVKSFDPANAMPFPLSSDGQKDPGEVEAGIGRDQSGFLSISNTTNLFDRLWVTNRDDWNRGTVSRLDTKALRETARYFSVTCNSLKTGSRMACDGTNGCCAADSYSQFLNRKNGMPGGPAQGIQPATSHNAFRVAVDWNGDAWVANASFGGQSSVTRIASDPARCIDRNGNGRIDTSRDVNGDGLIQTDCNHNGLPDDIADVMNVPCANGMAQEFYGLDDECVLLTTNIDAMNVYAALLALDPLPGNAGPSDVWAGTALGAKVFRIDGASGQTKDVAQLPNGCPISATELDGLAIDSAGIGWITGTQSLCYFDTRRPAQVGVTRLPVFGLSALSGISLDRDQNVWFTEWVGGGVNRYTPDRSAGFAQLGTGFYVRFKNIGTFQQEPTWISLDNRSRGAYYAWVSGLSGQVARLDASSVPLPKGQDAQVDASSAPTVQVAGTTTFSVVVDRSQNVWGISGQNSAVTRILVDAMGKMTVPDIQSAPMGNNSCPAGDRCALKDHMQDPASKAEGDPNGYALRNFSNRGWWAYTYQGCGANTKWLQATWADDLPKGATLTLRARSGGTPTPDSGWSAWSAPPSAASPADLKTVPPNLYLQVELDLYTADPLTTPTLKNLDLVYECP